MRIFGFRKRIFQESQIGVIAGAKKNMLQIHFSRLLRSRR